MGFFSGQVTVNDEPTKNRLYKFCEKKIDQWVRSHFEESSADALESNGEFRVEFTEEDGSPQIACMTEVCLNGALWRGYDLANDSQQAFMHSLKRLQPH